MCLLTAEKKGVLVSIMILGSFQGGAVAPRAVSIYLTDPRRKVQGDLGLSRDSFLDGLVLGIFLTTFMFGLGTDGGP